MKSMRSSGIVVSSSLVLWSPPPVHEEPGSALGQWLRHYPGHVLAGAVLVGAAAGGQGEFAVARAAQGQFDAGQGGVPDGAVPTARVGIQHGHGVLVVGG